MNLFSIFFFLFLEVVQLFCSFFKWIFGIARSLVVSISCFLKNKWMLCNVIEIWLIKFQSIVFSNLGREWYCVIKVGSIHYRSIVFFLTLVESYIAWLKLDLSIFDQLCFLLAWLRVLLCDSCNQSNLSS